MHMRDDRAGPRIYPLSRAELGWIALFWSGFAAFVITSRMLDPRFPTQSPNVTTGIVVVAVAEALLWALLTPLLFVLATRIGAEGRYRVAGVMLVLVAAIVAAIGTNAVMTWFRTEVLPDFIELPRQRVGRSMRGPFWRPRPFDPFSGLNDVLIALGIVAAGLARDYALRYRARRDEAEQLTQHAAALEVQLANARLDALRRQLDPHFLFNTLNTISGLVDRDPRGVRKMIARLGELLRYSIEGSSESEIPLRKELDLVQHYVDIMQVRFQGRLTVRMVVEDDVNDVLVPQLAVQTLVENAVRHGIEKIEGPGEIVITTRKANGHVLLTVEDNGPGISPSTRAPDASGNNVGVGLRNTRDRLLAIHGGRASLEIRNLPDGGAIAEMRVPLSAQRDRLPEST